MFASVAASAPPPASGSLVVPAVLGAGVIGGAALALLGGSSAPAAAPADSGNGAIAPITKRVRSQSAIHALDVRVAVHRGCEYALDGFLLCFSCACVGMYSLWISGHADQVSH